MSKWNPERIIAFDIETAGDLQEYALQPWRLQQGKARITSFAALHGGKMRGKLEPDRADIEKMLQFAIKNNCAILGWNITFDMAWLIAWGLGDLVNKINWLDGMLMWKHATISPEYDNGAKKSYGLKAAVKEIYPDQAGYEDGVIFDQVDELLLDYNKKDVQFTYDISKHWFEKLSDEQKRCLFIEAESLPLIAQANLNGMCVDLDAAHELVATLTAKVVELQAQLEPHGVTETILRSPKQLAKLIYQDWGLVCTLFTDTGAQSTDKEALHELSLLDARAKLLKEYREALNNKTKFAETLIESVTYNEDGKTHAQAIPFGTYSGRLTYSSNQGKGKNLKQTGFALHQMKRGKEYRKLIKAPEGFTLVEFDAANQEFRWMAIAANDETMKKLCLPGADAHQYMATQIDAEKPSRQLGKIANLSLQYRTSAKKLRTVARVQYGLPMEIPEAERIYSAYQETYTQVPVYWNAQIAKVKKDGYVETYAGRRVQMNKAKWKDYAWSMGSTAINYRIQGTGADQKFLALKYIKPYLLEIGGSFAWDLHDGLYFYIPSDVVDDAANHIKQLLDNLPYKQEWGFDPSIPLPWDCKTGKSWGDLTEYKFDVKAVKSEGVSPCRAETPSSLIGSTQDLEDKRSMTSLETEYTGSENVVQGVNFGSPKPKNNQEFLAAIFGNKWEDAWVTSYPPSWYGGRAKKALPTFQIANSAYFSVSLMQPEAKARGVKNVEAQYIIVLDDVGGKLPLEYASEHAPRPSYIIETSPNNFHWGYILKQPEKRLGLLKAFWQALGASPWKAACDGDDTARYMRMPYGNAFKPEYKGFNTKLTHWEPDVKYSIEDLAAALNVEMKLNSAGNGTDTDADAYAAEPMSVTAYDLGQDELKRDPLYQVWDRVVGIRGHKPEEGKWEVVCPWVDEHTTGADTAAYWPSINKFKCHHGHCSEKTTHDVAIKFGTDPRTAARYICEVFSPQPIEDRQKYQDSEREGGEREVPLESLFKLSKYRGILPADLPRREFVFRRHYIRKFISASIAPGGVGKSTVSLIEAISMVIGRGLLGQAEDAVREPLRVYYWNGEDPLDETERRIAAVQLFYGLTETELQMCKDNLFVASGRDQEVKIAAMGGASGKGGSNGAFIAVPMVKAILSQLIKEAVDVVILDPFVSTHSVSENDNNAIDMVVKQWAKIADEANCAIDLVHHSRKVYGDEVTVEDGRGASALLAAVRVARAFNVMTKAQAKKVGAHNNRAYFREDNGKSNMAPPPDGARWYRLQGVDLGNASMTGPADNVATVVHWDWPEDLGNDLTPDQQELILQRIRDEEPGTGPRAPDWVGYIIMDVLNMADNRDSRRRAREVLADLIEREIVAIVDRTAPGQRRNRPVVVVLEDE